VFASSADAQVEVHVADNGVGLSPEDRARVFGLFERMQPDVPGTGMGLAVARRMVERHGGTIAVTSPGPGQGSEFTVRLPISA
jgi:signal transduction histidine kinase